jgi:hypothetical protein
VKRRSSGAPHSTLAVVAAARLAVGSAMLLFPDRFFRPASGTETLLMQTIGVRDIALGLGTLRSWSGGGSSELRRWALVGTLSDGADLALGLRSKPLVGRRSAWIATLSPVPFLAAETVGLITGRSTTP